jgi:hypothetical protein
VIVGKAKQIKKSYTHTYSNWTLSALCDPQLVIFKVNTTCPVGEPNAVLAREGKST